MGSRAVVIIGRNQEAIVSGFGIEDVEIGICYTRTGRNFFNDAEIEKLFLKRVQAALTASGFWNDFNTEWVCLDTELMPWSMKAQSLIKDQYAAVGASASSALKLAIDQLSVSSNRGLAGINELLEQFKSKKESIDVYQTAYRQYCWNVTGIADFKLAPFHILATEGAVHQDKTHEWHMQAIQKISTADPEFLIETPFKVIDTESDTDILYIQNWWNELTGKGGEGIVIKPHDFVSFGNNGLVQPAIKCRGKQYLKMIYGPEYDFEEHLAVLKNRNVGKKRSLALREFALGMEALERFVRKEPLRSVHQCIFGLLALESEPVDPRL